MKLLMIDNYDSFTYNLVQYFGELGQEVRIFRNDQITIEGIEALRPRPAPWGLEPDAQAVHLFSEAGRLAFADRARYVADPDFVPAPGDRREIAFSRAAQCADDEAVAGHIPQARVLHRQDGIGEQAGDDADGDGISGRLNIVPDPRTGKPIVGRFGWKANVGTVEGQVAAAFLGDMGITSPLFPDENCHSDDPSCVAAIGGGSPEIPQETFDRVVFYNRTLAVPAMRDFESPHVRSGAEQFGTVGCAGCHTTSQTTGPADVPMLSEQTISPFTDLLLHDMGPGLADGRPDFAASGTEWRTPPLWGLGLVPVVNGERFMMHDGRARTFEEAIMWHGGEAQAAADAVGQHVADAQLVELDQPAEGRSVGGGGLHAGVHQRVERGDAQERQRQNASATLP